MSGSGERIYAWQEFADGGWGVIYAFVPAVGAGGQLIHRDERVAREYLGPIARSHVAKSGNELRLARYDFVGVEPT